MTRSRLRGGWQPTSFLASFHTSLHIPVSQSPHDTGGKEGARRHAGRKDGDFWDSHRARGCCGNLPGSAHLVLFSTSQPLSLPFSFGPPSTTQSNFPILNVLIHQWSHWPWLFSWRLLITDSIYLLVICPFIFSNSSCFSLFMFYVSRNLFISVWLYNLLAVNYSKRAVTILCIYAISAVMSPLSFISFIYLSLLFFLGNAANSLSICFPKLTFSIIDLFYSPFSL